MIEVVSTELMKESEKNMILQGATSKALTLQAAQAVFNNSKITPPVAVVCGGGNNGGDGFAIAKILHDKNIECEVILLEEKFTENSKYFYDICKKSQIRVVLYEKTTNFSRFPTIFDCIFGIGFSGEVRGKAKELIEKINNSPAYKISVDINSGLSADSGLADTCLQSDLTISLGAFKSGHFLNMAKDVIKCKINCDIGIKITNKPYYLLEDSDTLSCLKKRKNFSHKGTFGYVAIIAGSKKYSGAAKLANLACCCMASGAGVIKLAVPDCISNAVMPYLLESTLYPLSDQGGELLFNKNEIDDLISNVNTIAIGMGLGTGSQVKLLLEYLILNFNGTLIVDADAINSLAQMDLELLKKSKCKIILTPHLKEFSRLTQENSQKLQQNSIEIAKNFAKKYNVIVLLKGTCTIITDGDMVYLSDRGCAGMATAGSGDVLSGVLCAVAAYNQNNLPLAAATAAYIAGAAGEMASKKYSDISMTSSDTVEFIKTVIANLTKKR